MKRVFSIFLSLMLFAPVALASVSDIPLQVKSGESVSICAQQSYELEVLNDNGEVINDLDWSTSDDDIIWVRQNTKIMAVGIGSATLTGEAKDGSGEKVKVKVTVPKVYTTHDSITIDSPDGVEFGYAFNISGFLSVSLTGNCFSTDSLEDVGEISMIRLMPVKVGSGSIVFQSSGRTIKTVKINVAKSAFETEQPGADASLVPGSVEYAIVIKNVNIRKEPTSDSAKIGFAKKGEKLTVTQAFFTDSWHQISYDGETCYVSAKFCELQDAH